MRKGHAVLAVLIASRLALPGSASAVSPRIAETKDIIYMTDTVMGRPCADSPGTPFDLHYNVWYPDDGKAHPIVFTFQGRGFRSTSTCVEGNVESFENMDPEAETWASSGFVAVNVEYHGYDDGLFGDLTYPGPGQWDSIADGSVELNLKVAVNFFLSHNPAQYGAAESKGLIAFGGSAGGHAAHMLAITGPGGGHTIAAAIGWSGLPDAHDGGPSGENPFLTYMRATDPSDRMNFGDPYHRLAATSPPQYVANSTGEFIEEQNAINYWQLCRQVGVAACWLRIPPNNAHATAYENYCFTAQQGEVTKPQATLHITVFDDSIKFADKVLGRAVPPFTPC
jgi:hypothetical protein